MPTVKGWIEKILFKADMNYHNKGTKFLRLHQITGFHTLLKWNIMQENEPIYFYAL